MAPEAEDESEGESEGASDKVTKSGPFCVWHFGCVS